LKGDLLYPASPLILEPFQEFQIPLSMFQQAGGSLKSRDGKNRDKKAIKNAPRKASGRSKAPLLA
jgi:hypothetical protein